MFIEIKSFIRKSPKCFCNETVSTLLLLNVIKRELSLLVLFEKWTFWACLFGSGLNFIFQWGAQSLNFLWSLCNSWLKTNFPWTKEKKRCVISKKSFTFIKSRRGPKTEPCRTPDFISSQEELWPFRTTLCWHSSR